MYVSTQSPAISRLEPDVKSGVIGHEIESLCDR
jgi:hypothetical protein